MDLNWIWKGILIILVGTFLLRIAGRKSISQMTLAQTVLMIAIGSILIQPVADKNIWITFGIGAILIITLIGLEYVQLKWDTFEKIVTGKAKVLIENGVINKDNLRKHRLTVDLLEMQLRQNNVNKLTDVQWATLEPNGQLGYLLKEEAQPVTKSDLQQLTNQVQHLQQLVLNTVSPQTQFGELATQMNQLDKQLYQLRSKLNDDTIFTEVKNKGHKQSPPEHLQ
ncbi:DUF421 domain-containing protein [Halalkalibacter urbisdiaboli]|uniref:DUF421 domain-containing protein n=1 Tax=Halalkalibacter urbisdiaboli TaxID=1960589 RepID=UPI000B430051|nr:DUF421 domain-containing protein [Halalkalibacter urbisdiaboli]